MKHNDGFLATILRKILNTDVFNSLNKDNPFSCERKYSRTTKIKIYSKGQNYDNISDVFKLEDTVIGAINVNGDIFVCFEESRVSGGLSLYSLLFDDLIGRWQCNLWYSHVSPILTPSKTCKDRSELMHHCTDFCVLLRRKGDEINI